MLIIYEVSFCYGSIVIAKVKNDNIQTDTQTEQKQYNPDHSIRGQTKCYSNGPKIKTSPKFTRDKATAT